jgi:hypothetical protein
VGYETITDEIIEEFIAEQEGEPIQDKAIDEDMKLPPCRR